MTNEPNKSVFDKIRDASQSHEGVNLSSADLELLLEILGDAYDEAENEFETRLASSGCEEYELIRKPGWKVKSVC